MTYPFPIAEAWIEQQLADIAGKPSLFQRAADIFAEMHLAIQADGIRGSDAVRAAGSYGGIMKKWQAGLLQAITMDLIKQTKMDTGRLRIRSVQMDVFGRAQASKDLKHYAIKIRNGGGRAAAMPEVPELLKRAAQKYFADHRDDLKSAVQSSATVSG